MLLLRSESVRFLVVECLYRGGEEAVVVSRMYGPDIEFQPRKLTELRSEITDLLRQLPLVFFNETGADPLLVGTEDRDGAPWGLFADLDLLLCLGQAIGVVKFLLRDGEDFLCTVTV